MCVWLVCVARVAYLRDEWDEFDGWPDEEDDLLDVRRDLIRTQLKPARDAMVSQIGHLHNCQSDTQAGRQAYDVCPCVCCGDLPSPSGPASVESSTSTLRPGY